MEPVDDNFDYESTAISAQITNFLSRDKIDPSGIGRTVPIEFEGIVKTRQNFTDQDWEKLEHINNELKELEAKNKENLVGLLDTPLFYMLLKSVLAKLVSKDIIT